MNLRSIVAAAVVASALVACGGTELEGPGTLRAALTVENGRNLNGRNLNGRNLNGRNLNGRNLNGRNLNGRNLNGRDLNGRDLNGRNLNGRNLNGTVFGGAEFAAELALEGSELMLLAGSVVVARGADVVGFALVDEDGLEYRIDAAEVAGDVWTYDVKVHFSEWEPLCDEGAVPVAGFWDTRVGVETGGDHVPAPGMITFACGEGALGKCLAAGYGPWRGTWQALLHQTCTRAIRADYCGDGRSLTHDGTWINLYDGDGIQVDTEAWFFEAEWDAEGARCVSAVRRSAAPFVPRCGKALVAPDCGALEHFGSGTLLMTEFIPRSE